MVGMWIGDDRGSGVICDGISGVAWWLLREKREDATSIARAGQGSPRLLERVREAVRVRRHSRRTEKAYVGWLDDLVRAKRPARVPALLTREEVRALLGQLRGVQLLMASLLYGAGLGLLECCRLRIKVEDTPRCLVDRRSGSASIKQTRI